MNDDELSTRKQNMTHTKILAWMLFTILSVGINGRAQVTVDLQLDKSQILVGEQAELRATINAGKKAHIELPQFSPGDTLVTGIEIVRSEKPDTSFNAGPERMVVTGRYIITSFDSALYAIPPLEIMVDGKSYKSRGRCGLKVVSIPVDTVHIDNFAPPYASLEHPFEWRPNLLLSALPLLALIALLIFFAVRISMFKPLCRRVVIQPPTPPYKAAKEEMGRIAAKGFEDDSINKTFFIELTNNLRTYLSGRYGIAAPELTTEEILHEMHETGNASPERLLEMRNLLEMADYVKFAREEADASLRKQAFERVERFLTETVDEAMEHPVPIVKTVTLNGGTQLAAKVALITGGILSLATILSLTAWIVYRIYSTFL